MAQFDSNFEAILSLISAGGTLQSILTAGNVTGGTPIEITNGDYIRGEDTLGSDAFDLVLRGGNVTGGVGNGGDLLLFAGLGSGGGSNGIINVQGNTTFANNVNVLGTFTTPRLLGGAGSPEGFVTASPGALYQRSVPTSLGNAFYVKLTGVGAVGWAPGGPRVSQTFVANGVSDTFTLVGADTFYRNLSLPGVIDIQVYWNGVRQLYGASLDFIVVGSSAIQILNLDNGGDPPFLGDRIIIDYLPA